MGNCGGNNLPVNTSSSGSLPDATESQVIPFSKKYKLMGKLGEGGFGEVRIGFHYKEKSKYAVKIVRRDRLRPDEEEGLLYESAILQRLNHPHIVKGYELFKDERTYFLVLELLDGGELFDRIIQKASYSEREARDLVRILLSAIKYLHDGNIVHRDLKPENLLMTSKTDNANVKIVDFGFATPCEGFTITTTCGTPGYIAPEILDRKPYGKPVDMWSFGVILFILLSGAPPFHGNTQEELFRKIRRGDFIFLKHIWGHVSEDAKDFIRCLLNTNMRRRLTVDQALNHRWLGRSPEELAHLNLDKNMAALRKYQVRKRLRKAVNTVVAINRMQLLLAGRVTDANLPPTEKAASNESIDTASISLGEESKEHIRPAMPADNRI